ncbi:MAG: hypothetical protein IKL07_00555 [Clostridium sp.]|nr:hypothetical protein [Clostridium sp.]
MRKNIKKAIASAAMFSLLSGSIMITESTTVSASTIINNNPAVETVSFGGRNDSASICSSSGEKWYYNTGTSIPSKATPVYSKYKLLNNVKAGDIVYEANGGLGVTGHIAIVEGKYYDSTKKMYYIRVIEAISSGVVRSILDDTRVDDKAVTIYRVSGATSAQKTAALNFCKGELGSKYFCDLKKDTSSSETDWYCSELVWAGYKNQGIDIETTTGINEPGITPRDIARSSKVYKVSI